MKEFKVSGYKVNANGAVTSVIVKAKSFKDAAEKGAKAGRMAWNSVTVYGVKSTKTFNLNN